MDIMTWDIFDTLIARKCIEPHTVFDIVERKAGINGFAKARILSEREVQARLDNYTLDNIYEEYTRRFAIDDKLAVQLKTLEMDVELEQMIPIVQNINRVKSGDLLISDMYLPKDFILKMLRKAGLTVPVDVIVTSSGKTKSSFWKRISEQGLAIAHTGNDMYSDITVPGMLGADVALSNVAKLSLYEKSLLGQKQADMAQYLRTIRLLNPFAGEAEQKYWYVTSSGNLSTLIISLFLIAEFVRGQEYEFIGFCGRDCYYIQQMYEKLRLQQKDLPPSEYLYYSRKIVRADLDVYKKYITSKIQGRKALLIDLVGTGTHLGILREKSGINFDILICLWLSQSSIRKLYPDISAKKDQQWFGITDDITSSSTSNMSYYIIDLEQDHIKLSNSFELVNRAPHNSPVGLKEIATPIGDVFLPIFTKFSDTEYFNVIQECMELVLKHPIFTNKASDKELLLCLRMLLSIYSEDLAHNTLRAKYDIDNRISAHIFRQIDSKIIEK